MIEYQVQVQRSDEPMPREQQLAWQIARVATEPAPLEPDVVAMVINRVIDNAGVAAAALTRPPVRVAREQARAHPVTAGSEHGVGRGATVVGAPANVRVSPEWGAWANGVAVRELDFHDTFLAADYSHPGDNIPPLLAVAQHTRRSGEELVRAIATSYEVQVSLVRAICLHAHKIDHIAHLGPSVAAGLGTLLSLPPEVVYQAIGQALHTTTTTRQSRKGQISSWKAYAPGFAGKMAIEAVDRAMRGEESPAPIYEGADGVIAWLLDGPDARYSVSLPAPNEPRRAILDTYTKQHSAEYQAQAFIDVAFRLRDKLPDLAQVAEIVIHTSHHTHNVIGTGAGDSEKFDPRASRETLDHSLMYIFAVALEDGAWHHERSYSPERASRPETVALWQKVRTTEDPLWTKLYHSSDPNERAFGGRVEVRLADGSTVEDSLAVADAHPQGGHPFGRAEYIAKFRELSAGVISAQEQERFLSAATRLPELSADELDDLVLRGEDQGPEELGTRGGIF